MSRTPEPPKIGERLGRPEVLQRFGVPGAYGVNYSQDTNSVVLVLANSGNGRLYWKAYIPETGLLVFTAVGQKGDQDPDGALNRNLTMAKERGSRIFLLGRGFDAQGHGNLKYLGETGPPTGHVVGYDLGSDRRWRRTVVYGLPTEEHQIDFDTLMTFAFDDSVFVDSVPPGTDSAARVIPSDRSRLVRQLSDANASEGADYVYLSMPQLTRDSEGSSFYLSTTLERALTQDSAADPQTVGAHFDAVVDHSTAAIARAAGHDLRDAAVPYRYADIAGSNPAERPLKVTIHDIGNADCILVEFPRGTNWLVDVGSGAFAKLASRIPSLAIDQVVVSHAHGDHAADLTRVVTAFSPTRVVVGDSFWDHASPTLNAMRAALIGATSLEHVSAGGGSQNVDGCEVQWGYDDQPASNQENDRSIVISIKYGDTVVVLPGDIEDADSPACEGIHRFGLSALIKAPHHGSHNSAYQLASRVVSVLSLTVVSCRAIRNAGWWHPHKVALHAGNARGPVLRTDCCGDVEIVIPRDRIPTFANPKPCARPCAPGADWCNGWTLRPSMSSDRADCPKAQPANGRTFVGCERHCDKPCWLRGCPC